MKLVLDTSAYGALMRGDKEVADRVRRAVGIVLPAVVVGELNFGFRNGSRYEANRGDLNSFLENPFVEFLAVTMGTCDRFGMIAAGLRKKGTPIPVNDVWIAAQTMEIGGDLLTLDRHFERVDGLPVIVI